MDKDFSGLESKVSQVIGLCAELRAENHRLRDRIGALEEEKQALAERMNTACTRIEAIMERLPPE